ncbi:hypothetical protein I3760_02G045100 [Carya illinoinensis]|nr:RNA-binding protein 24-B-like isoform X3 [Carya illinoinensis]XP_042966405.1 RNA-binding protein 24-B-like isoform X3 [Carya illinoinensis]KAG2720652.1 hypothetical protein I3760_02G045100 [Carya illinoinensis]KAG6663751.1 hypothetical protein CIPAW_02G044700 [Carya illinoinensis]KAG6663752.1 hypothetical protein CIPAW_02G044700 [Carya illinoinensis]KAG6725710.1 hypothetical protein I3842_02G045300 [Carya illinoinensis]
MVGGNNPRQYNDTTFTKIFVGGLAWETQRDTMRRYFDQFGEILEAVVITDKNSGRSKGYGFVTFKDPEAALRACQNPSPVIDGRRANCNLASLGAQKIRPPTPLDGVSSSGRFRPVSGFHTPPAYYGTYYHQPRGQYTFLCSAYGYTRYSNNAMYPVNYYSVYGDQQSSPFYANTGTAGPPGMLHNLYPFYAQYAQSGRPHGFGVPYPQLVMYPYLPQHYGSTGILSLPSSMAMQTTTTAAAATTEVTTGAGVSQATRVASEQNSSTLPLLGKNNAFLKD